MLVAFLCTGTTSAFFHSDRNSLFIMQDFKIISKGLHNELPKILIIRILILSGPCGLFGFKFWIIFKISSWEKLMDVSDFLLPLTLSLVYSYILFYEKCKHRSSHFWRLLFCVFVCEFLCLLFLGCSNRFLVLFWFYKNTGLKVHSWFIFIHL